MLPKFTGFCDMITNEKNYKKEKHTLKKHLSSCRKKFRLINSLFRFKFVASQTWMTLLTFFINNVSFEYLLDIFLSANLLNI